MEYRDFEGNIGVTGTPAQTTANNNKAGNTLPPTNDAAQNTNDIPPDTIERMLDETPNGNTAAEKKDAAAEPTTSTAEAGPANHTEDALPDDITLQDLNIAISRIVNGDLIHSIIALFEEASRKLEKPKSYVSRVLNYDISHIYKCNHTLAPIVAEVLYTHGEKDIPTATTGFAVFRALRNSCSRMIRIQHHLRFLQENKATERIPRGLSLQKSINVIVPDVNLQIDLRRIQHRAEVEILDKLISHYLKALGLIRLDILSVLNSYDKESIERKTAIRSRLWFTLEGLIWELKETRENKSKPRERSRTRRDNPQQQGRQNAPDNREEEDTKKATQEPKEQREKREPNRRTKRRVQSQDPDDEDKEEDT